MPSEIGLDAGGHREDNNEKVGGGSQNEETGERVFVTKSEVEREGKKEPSGTEVFPLNPKLLPISFGCLLETFDGAWLKCTGEREILALSVVHPKIEPPRKNENGEGGCAEKDDFFARKLPSGGEKPESAREEKKEDAAFLLHESECPKSDHERAEICVCFPLGGGNQEAEDDAHAKKEEGLGVKPEDGDLAVISCEKENQTREGRPSTQRWAQTGGGEEEGGSGVNDGKRTNPEEIHPAHEPRTPRAQKRVARRVGDVAVVATVCNVIGRPRLATEKPFCLEKPVAETGGSLHRTGHGVDESDCENETCGANDSEPPKGAVGGLGALEKRESGCFPRDLTTVERAVSYFANFLFFLPM